MYKHGAIGALLDLYELVIHAEYNGENIEHSINTKLQLQNLQKVLWRNISRTNIKF